MYGLQQQQKIITKVKKYLRPTENLEAEETELMERMAVRDLVLLDRTEVKRYGKPYVRFTFDKAPEPEEEKETV